jgi:hypothetical protein
VSPRSAIAYFVVANVAQSGQRPKCTRCIWENAGTVPRRLSTTGAVRMWPEAAENDVRSESAIGDQSRLVVLTLSFVESDPQRANIW